MKRILLLNYEFPPLGGGAGNATFYLLKEFAKDPEIKIDLVTSSLDDFRSEKFSENINIHFLDIGKSGDLHYQSNFDLLIYSWKAYWYSKKLLKTTKFDICHAFFGIPCGYIAMKLGIPYIVSLRGSDVPFYNKRFHWLDTFLFKRLSVKIWKNAKKVIANSQKLRELALSSSPKQAIEVIYNGVDIKEFKPRSREHKGIFTILSTSRLIERKGLEFLMEAFIKLNKNFSDSRLLIVGNGDIKYKLIDMAHKEGIAEKVLFLGQVSHDQLWHFYNQADVFVLPSLNEGMSNSLLEAMASGLAVISTDTGGSKELVSYKNGIIVEKENPDDILKAFEKLYLDRNILENMKIESRKIAENFGWENTATEYLNIIKKVLI